MTAPGRTPSVPVTPDPERFDEAANAFRRRIPITKDQWDELEAEEREFAFTVAGVAQADMVADVWEALDRSIEKGTTLEDFKAEVGQMLESQWGGEDAARVETIFRTNIQGAYMTGRYEVFSAPAVKEARPYFRFEIIDDDRVDDECADLEGTILAQDDAFWNTHTPPLHFNCRCSVTGLSEAEAQDEGIDAEAPESDHADEGFGARPSEEGEDWTPDIDKYPDPIAAELAQKLGQ